MTDIIRTNKLRKTYGSVQALHHLDLNVPDGAIYALVGPNGAGKTTAVKVLMNIIRPSGGYAEVMGIPSTQLTGIPFTSIGYVSENQDMPGWMRVADFLAYLRPFYPSWDRDLESALVQQFDLPLNRRLKSLSRGMRMKAALASSLSYRPRLIVMDEPFSGLDPLVRDELIRGMLDRATDATVFISSHDLAEIESFASHVGYLDNGQLLFSEEMSTLSDRFREIEVTLPSPMSLSGPFPESWMQLESSGTVVRFVDSRFDPQRTRAELSHLFPSMQNERFTPMTLRSIFVAIARTKSPRQSGATA